MKNRLSLIYIIFASIISVLALYILINVLTAKMENRIPKIFGYSFHIVVTDSMTPEICVGDFILADSSQEKDVSVGDYIIFYSPDPSLNGMLIVHKVIEKDVDSEGNISFTTSGIKEGAQADGYPVKEILGKYAGKSAVIGKAIVFLSRLQNILFIIFITVITGVIVKQIKNIVKEKKGK